MIMRNARECPSKEYQRVVFVAYRPTAWTLNRHCQWIIHYCQWRSSDAVRKFLFLSFPFFLFSVGKIELELLQDSKRMSFCSPAAAFYNFLMNTLSTAQHRALEGLSSFYFYSLYIIIKSPEVEMEPTADYVPYALANADADVDADC